MLYTFTQGFPYSFYLFIFYGKEIENGIIVKSIKDVPHGIGGYILIISNDFCSHTVNTKYAFGGVLQKGFHQNIRENVSAILPTFSYNASSQIQVIDLHELLASAQPYHSTPNEHSGSSYTVAKDGGSQHSI